MKFRRVVGATALAGIAAGLGLLASTSIGAATTPPPPTPIALGATGMSSSACPLPINGTLAFAPGTSLQFKPDPVLSLSFGQAMTLTILSEAKTTPAPQPKPYSFTTASPAVAFPNAGTYDLSWTAKTLLGTVSSTGKIVISSSAQKCQVAVQVPVPSVSASGVPSSVTSPINGVVGGVVSGVNGALGPVNSAVGGVLGTVNGTVGGLTGGLTGVLPGGSNPVAGTPPTGSEPGTSYQLSGPTVAQRTVPQGYGNGSGAAGLYVPGTGNSINAPALGFTGTGKAGSGSSTAVKSGGSPKTVDLAANKPRSALDGWSALIVALAVIALSGATAFYARTFLLQPAPAGARAKA